MRLREELEEYKRREKEEKANIPLQVINDVEKTTKEIEAKIEERQRLDEQLEREKEQRALQLAIARENKRHLSAKLIEQEKSDAEALAEKLANDFEQDENKYEEENEKYIIKPNVPQFDRSIKPQLTARNARPQSPTVYALQKQRDFSPIKGSVVSVIL